MNSELELASILGALPDSNAEKTASVCESLSKEELREILLSELGLSESKEKLSWADSQGRALAHSLEKTALPAFLTPSVATAGKLMRGAIATPAGLRAGIGAGIGGLGGMAAADSGNKLQGGLMGAGLGALGGAYLNPAATALASGKGRLAGALRKGLQSEIGASRKLGDTQALSALEDASRSIKGARTERVKDALKLRRERQAAKGVNLPVERVAPQAPQPLVPSPTPTTSGAASVGSRTIQSPPQSLMLTPATAPATAPVTPAATAPVIAPATRVASPNRSSLIPPAAGPAMAPSAERVAQPTRASLIPTAPPTAVSPTIASPPTVSPEVAKAGNLLTRGKQWLRNRFSLGGASASA